jgi:hypothetical protein
MCDEFGDRGLDRAIVPGRQLIRLDLRQGGCGTERSDQGWQHGQGREHEAAGDAN